MSNQCGFDSGNLLTRITIEMGYTRFETGEIQTKINMVIVPEI